MTCYHRCTLTADSIYLDSSSNLNWYSQPTDLERVVSNVSRIAVEIREKATELGEQLGQLGIQIPYADDEIQ